jgi:hypothetical protein
LAILAGAVIRLRLRRYAIADNSMRPTLEDGDWVLAARTAPVPGDVVISDLPGRAGFEIVKRIAAVDPTDGSIWLLGDDPDAGSVDSRTFGAVPAETITAIVLARYHPFPPRLIR